MAAITDDLLTDFIEESLDALQDLPGYLEQFRQNPSDTNPIAAVFRGVHTIKGNAGFFELIAIKDFSHYLENTLEKLRDGKLTLSDELHRAIIRGFDTLDEMVQQVSDGCVRTELEAREAEVLEGIAEFVLDDQAAVGGDAIQVIQELAEEIAAAGLPQSSDWAARLHQLVKTETDTEKPDDDSSKPKRPETPGPETFANAKLQCQGHDVGPQVASLLKLFLATGNGEFNERLGSEFIDAVAEFAKWCEEKEEQPLADALKAAGADFKTIHESPVDVDSTLLSIIWDRLGPELNKLKAEDKANEEQEASSSTTGQATSTTEPSSGTAKSRLLRVNEGRLDEFVEDVASLFITCERFKNLHSRMAAERNDVVDELRQVTETLTSQTRALQQSVVALRKVPVRGLLSKFPRMARSLASGLGKKINVHTEDGDTEVDKSLFEDLDGPLTHMVRNVVDHAIDTPENRLQRGVEEEGNLWLKAEATRSHVIITVRDDGRGIDPERLRTKAVEKGIYTQSQADALTDQEAVDLIFHAGFSTAEQISDVSGRGVGMDVVRSNLRTHNADITVHSQVNVGTTFRMEIPIREAVVVVDGLLVEYSDEMFVVPLNDVLEICEVVPKDLNLVQGVPVANIRGEQQAVKPLGLLLDPDAEQWPEDEQLFGVLTKNNHSTMCVLVNRILGQRKVVIHSLPDIVRGAKRIYGVAQLGGGQLALVLNTAELFVPSTLNEKKTD